MPTSNPTKDNSDLASLDIEPQDESGFEWVSWFKLNL